MPSERMQCTCGCAEFSIWRSKNKKQFITMVCQYCGCRRQISSPGVAVDHYAMDPVLVSYDPDRPLKRPEHVWVPGVEAQYNHPGVLGLGIEESRSVGTGGK